MSRNIVLAISIALIMFNVHAQASTQTLFAVDLSLTARQRDTAYDVIREMTLVAPDNHTIGLTLFDDTVRRFIAPATLDAEQIRAINAAMADSLVSVRASSNLAVGIERAIDNPELKVPADLVIFARGVIDTPTQDPRARFSEWLALILLPQAARDNIMITLMIPEDQSADPVIKQAFASTAPHEVVYFTPGERAAPALVSLLGIADRPFGKRDWSLTTANDSPTATDPPVNNGTAIVVANDTTTPQADPWVIARILFLVIATILLCGIVYWRYRASRATPRQSSTTIKSSTYLPLTEKPSKTMDSWMEGQANSVNSHLSDNSPPAGIADPAPSTATKSVKSRQKEPWDQD